MKHLSRTMSSLGFILLLVFGWTHSQTTNYSRPVFKCGGTLDGDSGFIASEGFPSYYKPNSKCTWYITVPEGNVVTLSFRIFDLEADTLCRYDFVDVYNGHSNMVQKLGRFCGTFRPGTLISTSNTMMLHMESDSETGGRGFLAHFAGTKSHLNAIIGLSEEQTCGGKMMKPQGTINTPNWPEKNYPSGITCSWLITVEPDKVIEVKFDKFDVERDTYCRFDYVAFYNGGEMDTSRRIGKYCGDKAPEPIVTNSNILLVQFVSDQSVTSDGFIASYSSLPRGHSAQPGSSLPTVPRLTPNRKPVTTKTTKAPTTTTTTATPRRRPPANPNQPARPPNPESGRPDPARPGPNPLCPKTCKREGSIKNSFCSSDFVITGTVTALSPAPQGRLLATVSIVKAYKAGGLTITQAGETMTIKLVVMCRTCPVLRRGQNFILMGKVDEDGRGILPPGSFTALYKAQHHKILNSLNNQPC
ncbi:hypothetical protein QTP86_016965 [Hemibagrus guttatus]|nr:hypothetical protein QTP86_016965 [Hemibagrus guttatus]